MTSGISTGGVWWPLLLSTLAGLSTSIGALIAINLSPDESTLAFLLGSAVGVMSTVSIAELWWHKAVQHGNWLGITTAVLAGGVVFAVLDPLLPKPVEPQHLVQDKVCQQEEEPLMVHVQLDSQPQVTLATSVKRQSFAPRQAGMKLAVETAGHNLSSAKSGSPKALAAAAQGSGSLSSSASNSGTGGSKSSSQVLSHVDHGLDTSHLHIRTFGSDSSSHQQQQNGEGARCQGGGGSHISSSGSNSGSIQGQLQQLRAHHAGLMRLGILMALTMTLHNMPEGFAVAFSAMTSVGPMMCGAIAMHNIPEGLVIAAPIFAATGSKAKALAIATASGLSEPLGACVALFVFRPFVNSIERLDYVLAFVGGIMLAVCMLELWPEGKKCRQDVRLMQGIVLGSILMVWTLYAGV